MIEYTGYVLQVEPAYKMPFGRPPISPRSLADKYRQEGHSLGGGGNFNAGVFVVRRRSDGRKFVEKRMKPNEIANGSAKFEMFILRELKHRNVVDYIDAFVVDRGHHLRASLYMEYCEHGTLEAHLQRLQRGRREYIGEEAVWSLLKQLANALTYCQYGIHDAVSAIRLEDRARARHWIGVVHRDIKPANIFLRRRRDNNEEVFPDVVLGDFGQAIREDDIGNWERLLMGGDLNWAAPETRTRGYEYFADIWAVGAVVQAACRMETEKVRIGPNPVRPRGRVYWGVGRAYSDELDMIVSRLMCPNPRGRPEMWEVAPRLNYWSERACPGLMSGRR